MNPPDSDDLHGLAGRGADPRCDGIEVFAEIDSTNSYLMRATPPSPGRYRVALTDYQTQGRGQEGRRWYARPSTAICLSIAHSFRHRPRQLSSVALAAGAAVAEELARLGARELALKWPNDIMAGTAKLGGILVEHRGAATDTGTVVAGLGLNVDFRGASADEIVPERRAPVIDLAGIMDARPPRAALAGALIACLAAALERFDRHGFAAFRASWSRLDMLRGTAVRIRAASGTVSGVAGGIDDEGAILIETSGRRRRILSGTVLLPASTDRVA